MTVNNEVKEVEYTNELYHKAVIFAINRHKGQKRMDGKTEFITHPLAVAKSLQWLDEKIVAVLHDTIEDTHTTYQDIEVLFGTRVAKAVMLLTKPKDVFYERYIGDLRKSRNKLAIAVKIADIKHNLSSAEGIPDPDKRARLIEKWKKALKILEWEVVV